VQVLELVPGLLQHGTAFRQSRAIIDRSGLMDVRSGTSRNLFGTSYTFKHFCGSGVSTAGRVEGLARLPQARLWTLTCSCLLGVSHGSKEEPYREVKDVVAMKR
jgi:hypothetical protein